MSVASSAASDRDSYRSLSPLSEFSADLSSVVAMKKKSKKMLKSTKKSSEKPALKSGSKGNIRKKDKLPNIIQPQSRSSSVASGKSVKSDKSTKSKSSTKSRPKSGRPKSKTRSPRGSTRDKDDWSGSECSDRSAFLDSRSCSPANSVESRRISRGSLRSLRSSRIERRDSRESVLSSDSRSSFASSHVVSLSKMPPSIAFPPDARGARVKRMPRVFRVISRVSNVERDDGLTYSRAPL